MLDLLPPPESYEARAERLKVELLGLAIGTANFEAVQDHIQRLETKAMELRLLRARREAMGLRRRA